MANVLGGLGGAVSGGLGSAVVYVSANTAKLTADLAKAKAITESGTAAAGNSIKGMLANNIAAINVAAAAAGAAIIAYSVKAFMETERVAAQTEQALIATGGAAGVTSQEIQALATEIQGYSGISDEAVRTGQNMLLTFREITNVAGEGNDIFNQATVAMTDMATVMNGGVTPSAEQLSQTAIMLGKALNDPVLGLTALRKKGVMFTASQKEQIAAMVKAGDTMGAQKVILAELNKEYGGAAEAMGDTFAGQIEILKNRFNDMGESIGQRVVPQLSLLTMALSEVFAVGSGEAAAEGGLMGAWADSLGRTIDRTLPTFALFKAITTAMAGEQSKVGTITEESSAQIVAAFQAQTMTATQLQDSLMEAGWSEQEAGVQAAILANKAGVATTGLTGLGAATDELTAQTEELITAQNELVGDMMGLEEAADAQSDAQRELAAARRAEAKAIKEFGKNSKEAVAAHEAVEDAQRGSLNATHAMNKAVEEYTDKVAGGLDSEKAIAELRDIGKEAGLSGKEMRGYIADVRAAARAPDVTTKVKLDGVEKARADIDALWEKLNVFDGQTFTANAVVTGAKGALGRLQP